MPVRLFNYMCMIDIQMGYCKLDLDKKECAKYSRSFCFNFTVKSQGYELCKDENYMSKYGSTGSCDKPLTGLLLIFIWLRTLFQYAEYN
jgi:hypothetical protein